MSTPRHLLRLAPGLRGVRRGRDHLQVGLHPECRALLPRTPVVEALLARLVRPPDRAPPRDEAEPDRETHEALAELERRGCLVVLEDRPRPQIAVQCAAPLSALLDLPRLLHDAGLRTATAVDRSDLVVLVAAGEPEHDHVDHLVRRRLPHLVVRLVDGGAVLGPFVVPGRTACVRCVDAHRRLVDPDHDAVAARYQRALATPRPDGADLAPGLPLATARLAAAWAVRDVASYAAGREPSTWSRTLRLLGDAPVPSVESWARHPLCGCSWSEDDRVCGTMGA